MQIALIDDNEIDIFVNQKLLETTGIKANIKSFLSPVSAYNELQNDPVDLIIVDNQMPEMTGYDFLGKMLESNPGLNSKLIVLTATVRQDLRDKYNDLNEKIMLWEKPLNVEKLVALVSA